MRRARVALTALAVLALLGAALVGGVGATPTDTVAASDEPRPDAAANETLVVDADGGTGSDYRSLAAAVGAAGDGDIVRVMPGTYAGGVELTGNVTVVAPEGATVSNANAGGPENAFVVNAGHAAPTVTGFTVVGFEHGVYAVETGGDWTVRDTTFRDLGWAAVFAGQSSGDWVVTGVTVDRASTGVWSFGSTGSWRVEDTVVGNVSAGVQASDTAGDWTVADSLVHDARRGIEASGSTGAWTLRNVTVDTDADVEADDDEVLFTAVAARGSTGDWHVVDSTFRDGIVGVSAYETAGDWTVADTRFVNQTASDRYRFWQPPLTEGAAVFAAATNGSWTVTGSTFVDVGGPAIDASDASPAGTATANEFRDRDASAACTGNVSCGGEPTPTDRPTTGATESPTPHPPSTLEPTDSPTAGPGASTTDSPDDGTPTSRPPTHSREDGPLSRVVPVLAVLLAALGVGYRAHRSE